MANGWTDTVDLYDTSLPMVPDGSQELPPFTPAQIWQVMARQTALYTGADSSSIPVETAAELLDSVLFCLHAARQAGAIEAGRPLGAWLLAGQRELYRRQGQGLALQKRAEAACLPLENAVYREVLAETAYFFKWYDIRFFAHQIPCMIDYPLALPVEETLKGVDFINEYLRRRLWEDAFCAGFPLDEVTAALGRHIPDWRELPLNLYAPVLARALGGALLGAEHPSLRRTGGELKALKNSLRGQSPAVLKTRLEKATARLCNALRIWDTAARRYHTACAGTLASTLAAADDAGLARLFA